jgi:hypothetical protein
VVVRPKEAVAPAPTPIAKVGAASVETAIHVHLSLKVNCYVFDFGTRIVEAADVAVRVVTFVVPPPHLLRIIGHPT